MPTDRRDADAYDGLDHRDPAPDGKAPDRVERRAPRPVDPVGDPIAVNVRRFQY